MICTIEEYNDCTYKDRMPNLRSIIPADTCSVQDGIQSVYSYPCPYYTKVLRLKKDYRIDKELLNNATYSSKL